MKRKSTQSYNGGSSTTSSSLNLINSSSTGGSSSGFTKLVSKQTSVPPAITSAFSTPTEASVNKLRAATPAGLSLT